MSIDYKSWYENAKAELARVQAEKAGLEQAIDERDRQIAALLQTMTAIAPLVGEEPPAAPALDPPVTGMTGCIRRILTEAREPLTAGEVRDRREEIGFDLKSYSNALATIHTILRRLAESGEVETMHELASAKKFTIPVSKHLAVEKIAGKSFEIGKMKGFIGVGRLRRKSRLPNS